MINPSDTASDELYRSQLRVLVCGFLAGLAVAFIFCNLPFDLSGDLARAKSLGIVSKTIVAGYAKKRDVLNYAALVLLPVFFSLGGWLFWSRARKEALAELVAGETGEAGEKHFPGKRLWTLVILLMTLLATFNVNNFYEPAGGWGFLGEEGQFLAYAQAVLGGGDYAKDFFCLYGPLVVYPLALAMKLFGASVIVGRCYTYLLVLASASVIAFFLYHTVRGRLVFTFAMFITLLTFVPGGCRTGGTLLRVFLGFVPLLVLYCSGVNGRRAPAAVAGFAVGASLMFSQEVGICSGIAAAVFLFFEARAEKKWRLLMGQAAAAALGAALVVVPFLIYFYRVGASGRFFESLYGYPKLVTLGYGSLPFPSLGALFSRFSFAYFPYWMIGLYAAASVYLLVLVLLGRHDRDLHLRGALLVFGLLLFRAALGRSDESHFFFAAPPAFMLAYLLIDDALRAAGRGRVGAIGTGGRVAAAAVFSSLLVLFATAQVLRGNVANLFTELARAGSKFTIQRRGAEWPRPRSGGTSYDEATARDLFRIEAALKRNAREGEPVFFFPNEAAYYFLFNRPVPTRYVHAYFAASSPQRLDIVADLEKNRPACVVYTLDSWRIDDITEDIAVPEVAQYLREKYELAEDLGNILILRRKNP